MKTLVTGGAGFIGSHLVRELLSLGHEVTILDDLSSGKESNINVGAEFVCGSVEDRDLISELVGSVQTIYHLAAVSSVSRCNEFLSQSHSVNVTGFVNILDRVRHCVHRPVLIYASSAAVYGSGLEVPLVEGAGGLPESPYGVDKFSCELHARVAAQIYGLPTVGLRFFNVYGPGQDPTSPYSGVISKFVERVASGNSIFIEGDGKQTRDFISVEDVVRALITVSSGAPDSAKVYNVCTGIETSVYKLANEIFSVFGKEERISYVGGRLGDIRRSVGNPASIFRDFHFKANVGLLDGLASLAREYRLNGGG